MTAESKDANGPPTTWDRLSWMKCPVQQDVDYPDKTAVDGVLAQIGRLPPLVCPAEVERLRDQLREAELGRRFVLQGGDCAELFAYCAQDPIEAKLKVLLQMSLIIVWGARVPVVRIGRVAGQYAKPRSKPTEVIDGQTYNSFRGDNVNGHALADRTPDPQRLLQAYFHSAATLNYIRALLTAGFADLHHPEAWNLAHVKQSHVREKYEKTVRRMLDALDFMKVIGVDATDFGELPTMEHMQAIRSSLRRRSSDTASPGVVMRERAPDAPAAEPTSISTVDFFTSHEALLLDYEAQLTRTVPSGASYNLGAHFVWIGDRTRQLDGAHVEYCRGIRNPVGIKVGPATPPSALQTLLDRLNPHRERGKIVLITRLGHARVAELLPPLVQAVVAAGHPVLWMCDPMHGNTRTTDAGVKTRSFDDITAELSHTFDCHRSLGSRLGGVHFELTGDSVTECVGGQMQLTAQDLSLNYQSYCDPRLNYEQSLDMAFTIASLLQPAPA